VVSDGSEVVASLRRTTNLQRHTDTVAAAVFTCTHCNAVPQRIVDGKATIAVVRHQLGCPTLLAQSRARWPAVDAIGPARSVANPSALIRV
jgi:hypothetical protein